MKKLYIIGLILVLLAGGVGYGVWTMQQAMVPETTGMVPAVVSTTSDAVVSDHLTGQDSFQHLLTLGKALECSFRTSTDGVTTEGSAFFDNGKLRVDTMYTGASSSIETSSLIVSGDTMFTWAKTDKGMFAIKMPTAAAPKADDGTHKGEVSLQSNVQYDCKPWHVDGSVFVPPAGVTFMDMSTMMKGMPTGMMPPQP